MSQAENRTFLSCLILEDEPVIGLDLAFMLEDYGVNVFGPVPSIHAAREVLANSTPDVALLDAFQNDEWRELVGELQRRAIPFVVHSGRSRAECEVPSTVPWIMKPASEAQLLAALAAASPRFASSTEIATSCRSLCNVED